MVKLKQLFKHDPDNGVFGDCHRTALACLLNMDSPEKMPHIGRKEWENVDLFWAHFEKVLADRGLHEVKFAFNDLDGAKTTMHIVNPHTYYILGGKSANGCGHSVIAKGYDIVWDPSIDESGIVAPFDEDGFYWVSVLVPTSQRDK